MKIEQQEMKYKAYTSGSEAEERKRNEAERKRKEVCVRTDLGNSLRENTTLKKVKKLREKLEA